MGAISTAQASVVIPALNEEATISGVVEAVRAEKPGEVIVIDGDSTDATAREATAAGAQVINWANAGPAIAPRAGKGESLWRGVAAAQGKFVVFVDADLIDPPAQLVSRLLQPFADDDVHLVKPIYSRGFHGQPSGGGRVTELTAKPLLRLLYPELAHLAQPLGGEYALRRSSGLQLPFVEGFGVEAGMIIDVAQRWGSSAIAEVTLGTRYHRNKPLEHLSSMADVVAATIMARAGIKNIEIDQCSPLRDYGFD